MKFQYEAIDARGQVRLATLEADSREQAASSLRREGLTPMRLAEASEDGPAKVLRSGGTAPLDSLCLFFRQLKMLLEAGASLVPAIEAVERQTTRPSFRAVLAGMREKIETGASLSEAMREHPRAFGAVITTMVSAGEATATLPAVFDRLGRMLDRQRAARNTLVSAAVYPLLIALISTGVVALLLYFVVPRFQVLFTSLNHPLPIFTLILFQFANVARVWWPLGVVIVLAVISLAWYVRREPHLRAALDRIILNTPMLGDLMMRIETARFLRVWAAMLGAKLPLMDTIEQSRNAVTNSLFKKMLSEMAEAVSTGQRISDFLHGNRLVEPVIVSAISTGEQHGRLSEATEYVTTWLEEDTHQSLQRMVRLSEPLLLTGIGGVVGLIAMALFLPLFDIATAS